LAIGKTHRQNSIAAFVKTEISLFKFGAMSEILGDDASRIIKRVLGFRKADSVLSLIRQILIWIPSKLTFDIGGFYTMYGYFAIYKYGAAKRR
jgi:hypothetical protein